MSPPGAPFGAKNPVSGCRHFIMIWAQLKDMYLIKGSYWIG